MRDSGTMGVVVVLAIFLSGCARTLISFDTFPDGTAVPSQTSPVLDGGAITSAALISNQYDSRGATFSSGSPAVFAASFAGDVPSAPNAVCPTKADGTAGFGENTRIDIHERVCNVWVTITSTSAPATMTAYNSAGVQVDSASSSGSAPGQPGSAETLRVNHCDIDYVVLSGANYCFDNLKFGRN